MHAHDQITNRFQHVLRRWYSDIIFFFLAKHRFVSPLFPLLMQITNVYYVFPKNSNFLKSDEEEKENV